MFPGWQVLSRREARKFRVIIFSSTCISYLTLLWYLFKTSTFYTSIIKYFLLCFAGWQVLSRREATKFRVIIFSSTCIAYLTLLWYLFTTSTFFTSIIKYFLLCFAGWQVLSRREARKFRVVQQFVLIRNKKRSHNRGL